MKIVTQEMVFQRIADRWPDEPFEIVQYTRVSHPFQIKCLSCGKISSYSTFNNFITTKKEHWCTCHQNSNQAKHFQNQEKIIQLVENNPSKEELTLWIENSGLDIKKFFNTSGKLYKEMGLKDKLKDMSLEEKIDLLSTNGMLVKRPILIKDNTVLVGFKEDQYREIIK